MGPTIDVIRDALAEAQPLLPVGRARADTSAHCRRIRKFVNAVRAMRVGTEPQRGQLDVAFNAKRAVQDTIAQPKLLAHPLDIVIEIPLADAG